MYLKILIIICLNLFDSEIKLKACLILILLTIYYALLIIFPPYKTDYFIKLDKISILICYITIIFALLAYDLNETHIYLLYSSYLVIFIINAIYVVHVLRELLKTITTQFEESIETIKNLIIRYFPYLKRWIKNKNTYKYSAIWRRTRKWVLAYVREKKLNKRNTSNDKLKESKFIQRSKQFLRRMTMSFGTYFTNEKNKNKFQKNFEIEIEDTLFGKSPKFQNSIKNIHNFSEIEEKKSEKYIIYYF